MLNLEETLTWAISEMCVSENETVRAAKTFEESVKALTRDAGIGWKGLTIECDAHDVVQNMRKYHIEKNDIDIDMVDVFAYSCIVEICFHLCKEMEMVTDVDFYLQRHASEYYGDDYDWWSFMLSCNCVSSIQDVMDDSFMSYVEDPEFPEKFRSELETMSESFDIVKKMESLRKIIEAKGEK